MLRVGSVVPGVCGVAILGRLYGYDCRPLRTSPNLSLRYSHGPGGRWTSWRALLAEEASVLPLFGCGSRCWSSASASLTSLRRTLPTSRPITTREQLAFPRRSGGYRCTGATRNLRSRQGLPSHPCRRARRGHLHYGCRSLIVVLVLCVSLVCRHWLSYSSWRRNQKPVSLRPSGVRSSHWYMPQMPSTPRSYAE